MIIWILILAHLLVVSDLISVFKTPQGKSSIGFSSALLILLVWPISTAWGIVYTCILGLTVLYALIR